MKWTNANSGRGKRPIQCHYCSLVVASRLKSSPVCASERFLHTFSFWVSSFSPSCQNLPQMTRVRPEADNREDEWRSGWMWHLQTFLLAVNFVIFINLLYRFYALNCLLSPHQLRQRRRHLPLLEVSKHLLQTGTSKHAHLKHATWQQQAASSPLQLIKSWHMTHSIFQSLSKRPRFLSGEFSQNHFHRRILT